MNAPNHDMADILIAAGVGVMAAASGWSIHTNKEPTVPDTTITLYSYGGGRPAVNMLIDEPSVQARIRGAPGDWRPAYNKAVEVRDTLHAFARQTQGGTLYMAIFAMQDPNLLEYDQSNRPIFTLNFDITRKPAPGVHRP